MPQPNPKRIRRDQIRRDRITELRVQSGRGVTAFAEAVGISPQHIWNVEGGHKGASAVTLHKIAAGLHVEYEEIVNLDQVVAA